jgi:uncharacterized protein
MPRPAALTQREARWLALSAQGLDAPRRPRTRPAGTNQLRRVMEQLGTIQVDAVNVVQRTQFLVPFSRIGAYDPAGLRRMSEPGGAWFEYWGHAASLMPIELQPLLRWRMAFRRGDTPWGAAWFARRKAWRDEHADYIAAVLAEITERGPLAASQLSDPRRRAGEWWERRSSGRLALEWLFGAGDLAAWRSSGFERIYDLTERVIPAAVLDIPTPPEEDAQRALLALAARCLGVATAGDLGDYFWVRPAVAKLRVAELVEEGRLVPVSVEGWGRPAYTLPGARPRRPRREHATLLSPFDSLIWTRDRTERLFSFHYRIEIYVPEHLRKHGYYVLPLLLGDELVGRVALKSDRRARVLRVEGAYAEPTADRAAVAEAAAAELAALGAWLGLEGTVVARRGDLAGALARAGRNR